jgi:hypothetical protein
MKRQNYPSNITSRIFRIVTHYLGTISVEQIINFGHHFWAFFGLWLFFFFFFNHGLNLYEHVFFKAFYDFFRWA